MHRPSTPDANANDGYVRDFIDKDGQVFFVLDHEDKFSLAMDAGAEVSQMIYRAAAMASCRSA